MEKLSLLEEEMKLLSNIIKSFRVIESNIEIKKEPKVEQHQELIEKLLEDARKKAEDIILEAEKEANAIIEAANREYEHKLNSAYKKAKEILEDSRKEGYDLGCETGFKKGYEEGYDKGYSEGKEDSRKLIEEALNIKKDYIETRNRSLKELEEELIELVITIYEKVLYKKVDEDEDLIISLIAKGIDNLEISEKLTIIVSKDDYETVQKSKDLILAKASLVEDLEIRVNSNMKKGDCILETSKGSVDVSMGEQLKEVKDLLTSILSDE